MIWNHAVDEDWHYNPGNSDWILVTEIESKIVEAEREFVPGSGSYRELEERADAISYALTELHALDANTPRWWDFYPAPPEDVCRGENATVKVVKKTRNDTIVLPSCSAEAKATSRKRRRRLGLSA